MPPSPSIRTPLGALRAPQKTVREPYTNDTSEALPPSYSQAAVGRPPDTTRLSPSTSSFLSQSLSVTAVPTPEHLIRGNSSKPSLEPLADSLGHQPSRYSQQPSPLASPGLVSDKRAPYDDGIRPLHVFRDQQSTSPNVESLTAEALQSNAPTEGFLATSGLDKRRSINLSLPLSPPTVLPSSASSDHSPRPGCLESQSFDHSAIPPHLTAPDNSFKESSRPPSRNDSIYSNPSAAGPMQDDRQSRSSSIQANVDDTVVMSSPSCVTPDLDSSLTALTSLKPLPIQGEPQDKPSATLSPIDVNVQKRFSSPSDISLDGRSANNSRSASPAHRVDVPHSIESGTDTENENENENELKRPHITRRILPPAPPPKDSKGTRPIAYETEADINTSEMSQDGDVSEDLLESLRVERMSHSTFIAPALPPIRFSLNTTDFSELLGSVGGMTSLKSLDDAAMLIRQKQNDNTFTTPPSFVASKENATLPLSETSNSQTILEGASPAVHSSSDIYDYESSHPSESRIYPDQTQITITEPESTIPVSLGRNTSDLIYKTLQESSNSAKKTGAQHLHVDISLVDAIIKLIESQKAEYHNLTGKMEGMNVGNFPFFHRSLCSNCVEGE
jgi:Rho-type GTPase-activating protein 1/2